MARPTKQKVDYFPHYVKTGKTIYILEERYGNDGYAFWFKLLEYLCDSNGHFIDCRNQADWEFLLAKTHFEAKKAEDIISTLVTLGKIDADLWSKKIIWVQNLINNVSNVYDRRNGGMPEKPVFPDTETEDIQDKRKQKPIETAINVNKNTQRRVEDNKRKEKDTTYPFQDIVALWNEICGNSLPKVKSLTDDRRQKIKCRLTEFGGVNKEKWLANAKEIFERITASDFLCGNNGNQWTATFDWVFENSKNWIKVLEGNYDNNRGKRASPPKQDDVTLGIGEYIDAKTGRRTYGTGRATIPIEAPPRPSERHSWDSVSKSWVLL